MSPFFPDINGTITHFVHAGAMEIAEYSDSGALLRRYIPGPGTDQRVVMVICGSSANCRPNQSGTDTQYYFADRLGHVLAVTDNTGALEQRFSYTPFGVEMEGDPTGNPFRYTGRRYDPETGLYYYRARYYDADLGRFLQVDPIGYADQWNLYAYVANNPLNATDPTGESRLLRAAVNIGRRTIRNRGNVFRAVREEGADMLMTASTLVDPNASPLDKGLAVFDLASPVSSGEIRAGVRAVENAVDGIGDARRAARNTCCFVAGTLVDTEDGLRPIEEIEVGDRVWARDVETGETALQPVTDLIRRHERVIWEVELVAIDGAHELFETTDDHPWWIAGHGWLTTEDLAPGAAVVTRDGRGMVIARVEQTDRVNATFNLTVDVFQTYFVGQQWVLVHNCDPRSASSSLRRQNGRPVPDPEANGQAHTQLGTAESRRAGPYRQGREFDADGRPVRDIDHTDQGRPNEHTNPHQHTYEEVSGSFRRGRAEPLDD